MFLSSKRTESKGWFQVYMCATSLFGCGESCNMCEISSKL